MTVCFRGQASSPQWRPQPFSSRCPDASNSDVRIRAGASDLRGTAPAVKEMIVANAFAIFALGLRHGADPDHLAAIDNMTRNAVHRPWASRLIGTLFAGGHSVMVLGIAAVVGYFGARFASHSTLVETIGTLVSVIVLALIALLNMRTLATGGSRVAGVKTRLLPRMLRNASSPWVALPVGLLFGFGFETSSQVAAYTMAFTADAGVAGAILVGSMFCAGMACTDTLDSIFVHVLITNASGQASRTMRIWIWCVTIFALGIAAYELAQLLGWRSPLSELAISVVLVIGLLVVFAWLFLLTRTTINR